MTRRELQRLPIRLFKRADDWAAWLDKHCANSQGLRLRLAKKQAKVTSISYAEALEVALCYGWIDGQGQRYDDASWLVKFTPRRARSIWSKRNRQRALELIRSGKMKPSGLVAVKTAQRDGRWQAAYDSPSRAAVPKDFKAALDRRATVKSFFATLDRRNRYAILFRLQTAKKPPTRARRIQQVRLHAGAAAHGVSLTKRHVPSAQDCK
jgi:uncharacterized protein YdeI (YjbR/CyaY-like superfamily)